MTGKKVATFRERFTELIESSPKSRTEIALDVGVAKQTISAWLTGQNSPRLPVVVALAEYFGVDVRWLNGFDVPKYSLPAEKTEPPDNPPEINAPKTPEARAVSFGMDQLPQEQREMILNMVRAMFPNNKFTEGDENDR